MSEKFEIKLNPSNFHTAIKVEDMKESIRFYHEILGLPIIRRIPSSDNPEIVFLPGIELSELSEKESSEEPNFFGHIGIAVDNIEEVCKRLEAHGVEFEKPLEEIVFEEIQERLKLAFCRDPDGIMVEFVKWSPQ